MAGKGAQNAVEKPSELLHNLSDSELPHEEYLKKANENLEIMEKHSNSFKALGPCIKGQLQSSLKLIARLVEERSAEPVTDRQFEIDASDDDQTAELKKLLSEYQKKFRLLEKVREETEHKRVESEREKSESNAEWTKQMKDFENEINLNRKIIHEKAQESKKLNQELDQLKEAGNKLKVEVATLKSENQRLKVEKKEANENLIEGIKSQLNDTLNVSFGNRERLCTEESNELRAKIAGLERALADRETLLAELRSKLEELRESESELNEQLREKNAMLREAHVELENLKKSLAECKRDQAEQRAESAERNAQSNVTGGELSALDRLMQAPRNPTTRGPNQNQIEKAARRRPGDHTQFPPLASGNHENAWLSRNVPLRSRPSPPPRADGDFRPTEDRPPRQRVHLIAVNKRSTGLYTTQEILVRTRQILLPFRKEIEFADIYMNKNGKTIIKHHKKEDGEKILEALKKIENETEAWRVGEKRRLIIKGIPSHLTKEEIMADLSEVNGISVRADQLRQLNGSGYSSQRAILTIDEEEAKRILSQTDRVILEFKSCPIERDLKPLQCFVCGGFNHSAYKFGKLVCTNKPTCAKCGDETDQPRDPTHECNVDNKRCSNCKATDHSASSKACPIYQKLLRDLANRW